MYRTSISSIFGRPRDVVVEGRQLHLGAGDELVNDERTAADEIGAPEPQVGEARLIVEVAVLQEVLRQRGPEEVAEQPIGLRKRTAPLGDDRAVVARFDALQVLEEGGPVVRGQLQVRELSAHGRPEHGIASRDRHPIMPFGAGRIVIVVSMRPSGNSFHCPFSRVGADSASKAVGLPGGSKATSGELNMSITHSPTAPVPPQISGASPRTATVMRFLICGA